MHWVSFVERKHRRERGLWTWKEWNETSNPCVYFHCSWRSLRSLHLHCITLVSRDCSPTPFPFFLGGGGFLPLFCVLRQAIDASCPTSCRLSLVIIILPRAQGEHEVDGVNQPICGVREFVTDMSCFLKTFLIVWRHSMVTSIALFSVAFSQQTLLLVERTDGRILTIFHCTLCKFLVI